MQNQSYFAGSAVGALKPQHQAQNPKPLSLALSNCGSRGLARSTECPASGESSSFCSGMALPVRSPPCRYDGLDAKPSIHSCHLALAKMARIRFTNPVGCLMCLPAFVFSALGAFGLLRRSRHSCVCGIHSPPIPHAKASHSHQTTAGRESPMSLSHRP